MKNILAAPLALAFVILANPAFSQKYKTAAGVRFENGFNFTVQQYITNGWTAEGILHTPILTHDLGVTLLAEKHHKILFRGTNFYMGGGAHYYWNADANREAGVVQNNVFGLSAIGGLELTLGRINLAVDWKPELHLSGDEVHPFDWHGAAISARYIIEKRERRKIKDWKIFHKSEGKSNNKSNNKSNGKNNKKR